MKRKMRTWIPILVLATFFLGTKFSYAHFFWIETDNKPTVRGRHEIRIFLGHPDMPDTNIVPELVSTSVHKPDGSVANLNTEKVADHCKASLIVDQSGDYIVTAVREPGFFDPKWHDHDGPGRIVKDYAKIIIYNRSAVENWGKVVGQELEIVPLIKPYTLHVGDTFKAKVLYKGKPAMVLYSAAPATQNIHDTQGVQAGMTQKDGSFAIKIDKGGMWVAMVESSFEKTGTWTAAHDLVYKGKTYYSRGEKLPYGVVKYRHTVTFWVAEK